ncbi:MAG: hypothetical protein ACTIL2_07490 [Corynebacterium sp.]|uniref:hypothetical protein n=1 Tax=Corynebacterium sp. TaxID=1720 RepID=UPI003F948E83
MRSPRFGASAPRLAAAAVAAAVLSVSATACSLNGSTHDAAEGRDLSSKKLGGAAGGGTPVAPPESEPGFDTGNPAGVDASEALTEFSRAAQEYGYSCLMAPSIPFDMVPYASCTPADPEDTDQLIDFPVIQVYDREDVATGAEVAEEELRMVQEYDESGTLTRNFLTRSYRPVDGENLSGVCHDSLNGCSGPVEALGLTLGMLDADDGQDVR